MSGYLRIVFYSKMAAAKSKVDYLKRYGYKPEDPSAKKKIKRVKKVPQAGKVIPRSKIFDDDFDINAAAPNEFDDGELETGEDAPQIAGIVDDRPLELQTKEAFASNKWRAFGDGDNDEGEGRLSGNHEHMRHRRDSNSDRSRHDSDSDQASPSRNSRHDSDVSPPRQRVRHDSDESPPRRRQKARHDLDVSPPRKKAQLDSDESPPRKKTQQDSDESPPRKRAQQDSDESPPRKRQQNQDKRMHAKVASDYFPTRRKNPTSDSDNSPPRQASSKHSSRNKRESDSDHSPPRNRLSHKDRNRKGHKIDKNNETDSDASPPRKSRENLTLQKKTLDGKKAGLQDAKTLKLENEAARKRERRLFEKMDEEVSGKNSKTILRDRSTGMRRNLEEERRKQMEEDAVKAEREAKYNQWGKGVKQTEMQKYTLEQTLKEISKPLARYGDDEDLDKVLRDQDREGDPMLAFIKKKKVVNSSGKELPKYNGPQPPPNRFGIMPGYRWDGVDRSNGFEKARFSRLSSKVAAEKEAYKWSVEDM